MFKVCGKGGHWIGIIETNYDWALKYWTNRGYILVKV